MAREMSEPWYHRPHRFRYARALAKIRFFGLASQMYLPALAPRRLRLFGAISQSHPNSVDMPDFGGSPSAI